MICVGHGSHVKGALRRTLQQVLRDAKQPSCESVSVDSPTPCHMSSCLTCTSCAHLAVFPCCVLCHVRSLLGCWSKIFRLVRVRVRFKVRVGFTARLVHRARTRYPDLVRHCVAAAAHLRTLFGTLSAPCVSSCISHHTCATVPDNGMEFTHSNVVATHLSQLSVLPSSQGSGNSGPPPMDCPLPDRLDPSLQYPIGPVPIASANQPPPLLWPAPALPVAHQVQLC